MWSRHSRCPAVLLLWARASCAVDTWIKRGGNWVRLRPYEPCLRGMSRSTRSRAYTWLREAGLIETGASWVIGWRPGFCPGSPKMAEIAFLPRVFIGRTPYGSEFFYDHRFGVMGRGTLTWLGAAADLDADAAGPPIWTPMRRARCVRWPCGGGPYSAAERQALLDYCFADVVALRALLPPMWADIRARRGGAHTGGTGLGSRRC